MTNELQSQPHGRLNTGLSTIILLIVLLVAGTAIWYTWSQGKKTATTTTNIPTNTNANTNAGSASATDEAKALGLVRARPEVQTWLKLFTGPNSTNPKMKSKAVIEVDHVDGDTMSVHAYEQLPDHTATFGWFDVNRKTWVVTPAL